jgi:hypothetical protein
LAFACTAAEAKALAQSLLERAALANKVHVDWDADSQATGTPYRHPRSSLQQPRNQRSTLG